jgi:hypothetical protein
LSRAGILGTRGHRLVLRAASIASEKILSFHFIAADAKLFAVQSVVRQQLPALISSGHDGELRDFSAFGAFALG